ncbi:hypothetical protein WN55_00124 [Dufourea novaeangliae]|uniref:DUF4817 domain-containing protein n=1 Tax=Dufourea novaeangliae TaxID=178035 RepID=A0A154NXX8_DUFNO|nr:hypothetical protein WN55_00124 [Dufourea novaeangliae]
MGRCTLAQRIQIVKIHYKNDKNFTEIVRKCTLFGRNKTPCRTAIANLIKKFQLFGHVFPKGVISRNGDFNWPPRSCDLTPLDFFLWGYVKDKIYSNAPATIQALKDNIGAVIREIQPDLCESVMKNYLKRMAV